MAGQAGKDFLLKLDEDGAGSFITMGGMRSKSLTINGEMIDTTDSDSTGLWRELLDGGGVASMAVSGAGVFKDTAAEQKAVEYSMNRTVRDWQIVVPGLGTFQGAFQVTSCELSGEHTDAVATSFSLESGGQVTFTAT